MKKPELLPIAAIPKASKAQRLKAKIIDLFTTKGKKKTKIWKYRPPMSQNKYGGACVGFSRGNWLNSEPRMKHVDEQFCVDLWNLAKRRDMWPENDNDPNGGTDPDIADRILRQNNIIIGKIKDFWSKKSIKKALLNEGPILFATDWYDGMDIPDENGYIYPTGEIRGGHAIVLIGFDKGDVLFLNSWAGYEPWDKFGQVARMKFKDFGKLTASGNYGVIAEKTKEKHVRIVIPYIAR